MKISPKGVLEIAEHEGIALGPYKDSVGVWTSGIGHTAAAGGHNPAATTRIDTRALTDRQVTERLLDAVRVFDVDLDKYEARVNKAVTAPLKQHEFDALVSFDFNTGGIFRAKLTEAINAGDKSGDGFMGWLKPPEIAKRRKAEQALFRTGNYDANGSNISIWDATPNGNLKYRGVIDGERLADLMGNVGATHKPSIGWLRRLFRWVKTLRNRDPDRKDRT